MGRIAYSRAQMAEAVVLAAIVGADAASSRLGMGAKAIRRWSERAGTVPADSIGQADWEHLGALAKAQVQSDLLAGRLTTVQAATVAGIAQRHAAKPEPVAEPPTPAEQWADTLETTIVSQYGPDADLALMAALEYLDTSEAPSVDAILAYLASLGDLGVWRAARDDERHDAMTAQLAANREKAEAAQVNLEAARLTGAALVSYATAGVRHVDMSAALPDVCPACQAVAGRRFALADAPAIPVPGCSNAFCRCNYSPVVD